MARKKKYNEDEVIEKAMALFWRNGYESTSVRELEKEMGINQFSIYASFGSKQGVFLESVKCYEKKIRSITEKLSKSSNGLTGIKQFFYDFLSFSMDEKGQNGCLLINTVNEIGLTGDPDILDEILKFSNYIKSLFINNLNQIGQFSDEYIERRANYYFIALQGLTVASKVFPKAEIEDFIEITFEK
ncbi:TetR/AcrR family transcriptional regulator [Membranihabitans marinus]|uniref:TetR/AcrR family transcriptional regulator n=1 Tax=Membranihabitans marinus TaxID=1227546 RepID=UPI001F2F93D6|nr:TetR/AcrR family transcriptional regulator [Membranihabitans marinus]